MTQLGHDKLFLIYFGIDRWSPYLVAHLGSVKLALAPLGGITNFWSPHR